MKYFLIICALLVMSFGIVYGQTESAPVFHSDFSLYHLSVTKTVPKVIPWYVYVDENIVVEGRWNFDVPEAMSIFIGIPFGEGLWTLVPEIGYVSDPSYGAVSGEIFFFGANEQYTHVSINQFLRGIDGNLNYAYHWYEGSWYMGEKTWQVGISEQIYKELNDAPWYIDIGPLVRYNAGQAYVKLWPTWSPTQPGTCKCYLGIGYVF